jgi:hypothetical protein
MAKPQNATLLPDLPDGSACPSASSIARFQSKKSGENYRGDFTKPRLAA